MISTIPGISNSISSVLYEIYERSYYSDSESKSKITFKENFVQSIIGTKTNSANEESAYTIEQIVKPEYKTKIEVLFFSCKKSFKPLSLEKDSLSH